MFTVSGTIDNVAYRVGVHPEGVEDPDAYGVVMGSGSAISMLRAYEGDEITATPTSEPVVVDPKDAASVLASLYALTAVSDVTGEDIPDVLAAAETPPGAVH